MPLVGKHNPPRKWESHKKSTCNGLRALKRGHGSDWEQNVYNLFFESAIKTAYQAWRCFGIFDAITQAQCLMESRDTRKTTNSFLQMLLLDERLQTV